MPPSSGTSQLLSPLVSPDIPASRPPSSHLHPEDAYSSFGNSKSTPPRKNRKTSPLGRSDTITASNNGSEISRSRTREKRRGRDGGTVRKRGTWKKLLWVKQAYPDNYTDELQFLSHLQRNPRLRPYEFWPLVADSTIIVQHVASVIIFICCFVGIFQERVAPVSVVSWATFGTVLGWIARDWWISCEEEQQRQEEELIAAAEKLDEANAGSGETANGGTDGVTTGATTPGSDSLGITLSGGLGTEAASRTTSVGSMSATTSTLHSRNSSLASEPRLITSHPPLSPIKDTWTPATATPMNLTTGHPNGASTFATYSHYPPYEGRVSRFSPRNQERMATAKSAMIIICALLGLSPILKSLTKSTSPDSIWAMSSWLIVINIFTFDYGAGVEAKFPAPLSTNAGVMASTVLASRLPSTLHVFSLTLFSIEVFGLFPVFRRHLRHMSWVGHLALTAFLIVAAGGGLCMIITGGGWRAAVVGVVLGGLLTSLAMGMTSWWLIGLQRYKNEIQGPWDPARPILRRHWD
ncbi:hypothetical protein KVT40_002620 [Elsinoe batatas]|uniref:Phosphatidylinositol N-acetylglucosaminyltransferase GPI2 subunit n=1 Tax=Elsinoe batatas TaxID=2601811 RepID=A0A8K0PE28_9PEZI|nr:hypothetical protein KVT40_002620 [Elsinoe batatas]